MSPVEVDPNPTPEKLLADIEEAEVHVEKVKRKKARRVTLRRWVLVVGLAIGMAIVGYDVYISHQSNQQLQVIQNLTAANLASQNAHHAQTNKKNAELQETINEVKAAQQQGQQKLDLQGMLATQLTTDEQQLSAALNKGQAQITAYLHYLSCLGTHPGNVASCGAAPPLPVTTPTTP